MIGNIKVIMIYQYIYNRSYQIDHEKLFFYDFDALLLNFNLISFSKSE